MPDTPFPTIIQPDLKQPPPLKPGEVHLYVLSVPELNAELATLGAHLCDEEQQRASRFINPQHGDDYRCIRGMLRRLIARYISVEPESLEFAYAEHGKPSLVGTELYFNLSHSRERAAMAFSLDGELGVDIEFMRDRSHFEGLIGHVASAEEQQQLAAMSESDRFDAFYRLWTRKEAFIKGVGRGLGMGLRSIHVGADACPGFRAAQYKGESMTEWQITDLTAPSDYHLALCINWPRP